MIQTQFPELRISLSKMPVGMHKDRLVQILQKLYTLQEEDLRTLRTEKDATIETCFDKDKWFLSRWTERFVGSTPLLVFNGTMPLIASVLNDGEHRLFLEKMRKRFPRDFTTNIPPLAEGHPLRFEFERDLTAADDVKYTIRFQTIDDLMLVPSIVSVSVFRQSAFLGRDEMLKHGAPVEPIVAHDTFGITVFGTFHEETGVLLQERFSPGKYTLRVFGKSDKLFDYSIEFSGSMAILPKVEEIL